MGIVMLIGVGILLSDREDAFEFILWIYGFTMLFRGISRLIYYFTLSRYMVDGKLMLYIGVVFIDFGVLTLSLRDLPMIYIVFYILGIHAFSGLVDILRALESRRYGGNNWQLNFSYGLANILMAVLCLIMIHSSIVVLLVYCAGIVYSAIVKIITAFQRTAVIYIP